MSQAALQNSSTQTQAHVLVVEDDATLREALVDTLDLANFTVSACDSGESALNRLRQHADIAMVISDVNMGGMSGFDLLKAARQNHPHIPVLLITAYGSVSQSVAAMRDGAVDYLVKPIAAEQLVEAVNRYASPLVHNDGENPVAAAASSQQLLNLARRVAQADSTVLIVGESGTGKEVLARYIHTQSPRAGQSFVAINCAAIPENMLEAMLFGHEKGAYTGAYSSAPGKFEQANGGTLLLDEISEMDLGLQAKLLRVLQEREVERLGGRKTINLDVRVIATSNRNLQQAVAAGDFREDLYYRLSVLPLQWAPLRERRDDIIPLARQLLARHAGKQHRRNVTISAEALQALRAYPWPGNVRELDNVMQRALILQPGMIIEAADLALPETVCGDPRSIIPCGSASVENLHSELTTESSTATGDNFGSISQPQSSPTLGADLKQREFEIIVDSLRKEGGSRKRCAERLRISARTLRYKIARLREQGLDVNAALRTSD